MPSRFPKSLVAVFDAYEDDAAAGLVALATAGLVALANTDPPLWHSYVDAAAERQYRSDYARHRRSLIVLARKDDLSATRGQARLFEVDDSDALVRLREVLVLDGSQHRLAELAGADGAAVLRRVAERDLAPATTVVSRCRTMLKLADHLETESTRLRRDVSVGEVLTLGAAA